MIKLLNLKLMFLTNFNSMIDQVLKTLTRIWSCYSHYFFYLIWRYGRKFRLQHQSEEIFLIFINNYEIFKKIYQNNFFYKFFKIKIRYIFLYQRNRFIFSLSFFSSSGQKFIIYLVVLSIFFYLFSSIYTFITIKTFIFNLIII